MDEKIICKNIKKLRKQNNLTLEKLAILTGLTKGYLSKVERSEKAPPYSTLTRIAGALGVEMTTMLSENIEPLTDVRLCLSRGKNRKIIKETSQFSGYDYEILAENKPLSSMHPGRLEKCIPTKVKNLCILWKAPLNSYMGKKPMCWKKGIMFTLTPVSPIPAKALETKKPDFW